MIISDYFKIPIHIPIPIIFGILVVVVIQSTLGRKISKGSKRLDENYVP